MPTLIENTADIVEMETAGDCVVITVIEAQGATFFFADEKMPGDGMVYELEHVPVPNSLTAIVNNAVYETTTSGKVVTLQNMPFDVMPSDRVRFVYSYLTA